MCLPSRGGVRRVQATEGARDSPGDEYGGPSMLTTRLTACTHTLGLEPSKCSYGLRPVHLTDQKAQTTLVDLAADVFLEVLEHLADRDKVSLATACSTLLKEQRRLRPTTAYRKRISLSLLVGARKAGWRVERAFVDKRSGGWVTSNQSDNVLAELEVLSIVCRPDCALLVLSPFTDLTAMSRLRVFEMDSCAIGNAGVGVLSAAFRNGAMSALNVLDLRRNQIGDGGAQALSTAFSHKDGSMLRHLHTLGLDRNCIGEVGLEALAETLRVTSAARALRNLLVDVPDHPSLRAVCDERRIDVSSW